MPGMDVSFIIVNYNTASWVKQCVQSIRAHTVSLRYEIIIVDNASPNRAIDAVINHLQDSTLIYLPLNHNSGFGAANNRGVTKATGKYLFLLNPDTRLCSNAAGYFFSYMEQPDNDRVVACGADLRDDAGKPTQAYGNFPSILHAISALGLRIFYPTYFKKHMSMGAANEGDAIKEVDYISGAAMFIRKAIIDIEGFFDEAFFLFFEETEWAYRMRKAGYSVRLLPAVQIIHSESASDPDKTVFNRFRYYHYEKSRQLFYHKTKGDFFAAYMKPLDILHMCLRTITQKEKGNILEKLNIIWQA